MYIYSERQRDTQRVLTKQIEKKCGLTFTCKT